MNPNRLLEQFINQFNSTPGSGASALGDEVKQQIRTALTAAFNKLDLVPREEFDAQRAVLQRTREKLEALEKAVAELEEKLNKQ